MSLPCFVTVVSTQLIDQSKNTLEKVAYIDAAGGIISIFASARCLFERESQTSALVVLRKGIRNGLRGDAASGQRELLPPK